MSRWTLDHIDLEDSGGSENLNLNPLATVNLSSVSNDLNNDRLSFHHTVRNQDSNKLDTHPGGIENNKNDSNKIDSKIYSDTNNNDSNNRGLFSNFKRKWFFQPSAFQPYFNVSTKSVIDRLLLSLHPLDRRPLWDTCSPENYENGELYGPTWIAFTLALCLSMISNVHSLFSHKMKTQNDENDYQLWTSDFNKVYVAFVLVMCMIWILPAFIWAVLTYYESKSKYTRIVSLIGYSHTIFIPAVTLCIIPLSIIQWILILTAYIIAFKFIYTNIRAEVEQCVNSPVKVALYAAIGVVLIVFVVVIKTYFFS